VNASNITETCTETPNYESNYLYFLNMFTGNQPKTQIFDVEGTDGGTNTPNIVAEGGGDTAVIEGTDKKYIIPTCPPGQTCESPPLNMPKFPGRRVNWRQK
jgi:hypothetical protein